MADKVVGLRVFADARGKDESRSGRRRRSGAGRLAIHALRRCGEGAAAVVRRRRTAGDRDSALPAFPRRTAEPRSDVASGEFGADMQVALVNDGPVTLMLERLPDEHADPGPGVGVAASQAAARDAATFRCWSPGECPGDRRCPARRPRPTRAAWRATRRAPCPGSSSSAPTPSWCSTAGFWRSRSMMPTRSACSGRCRGARTP